LWTISGLTKKIVFDSLLSFQHWRIWNSVSKVKQCSVWRCFITENQMASSYW